MIGGNDQHCVVAVEKDGACDAEKDDRAEFNSIKVGSDLRQSDTMALTAVRQRSCED